MAVHDPDALDGFPAVVSPGGSGGYSPSGNNHMKQPYSPCTTQALSPAITNYNSGGLAGPYSPTKASRETVETSAQAVLPSSSQNQGEGPDRDVSPQKTQGDQCLHQRYCSEDLQQRMQGLWSSNATDFDNYDDCNLQRMGSDPTVPDVLVSQPSTVQHRSDRTSVWGLAPSFHTLPESDHHRLYYPSRLDLCSPAERSQPTSTSYSTVMEDLARCYQSAGSNYPGFPPAANSYQYQVTAGSLPTTSLSPCSSTLAGAPMAMGREDKTPLSGPDLGLDAGMDYDAGLYDTEDVLGSRSSAEPAGGKSDEPYAQLIYKAFMSRQDKSMTLQEIYQWFRENTDKTKCEGKGWQNSIRHNLSMNGAFTKRSSKQTGLNSDGSVSLDTSGVDGRKSTEWFLEPRYYSGVESTTRYRKGNNRGASRASRGARLADGTTHSVSRVAAGRKGGYQAAQHRKKVKAEQQQQQHHQQQQGRHHHQPQYHLHRLAGPQCFPGDYIAEYTSHPPHHHHQPSPLPDTIAPSAYQAGYGVPGIRGSLNHHYLDPRNRHLGAHNYFQSEDLVSGHVKRSRTLQSDNDHISEPTTPPGSALDSPMEDLSLGGGGGGGNGSKQPAAAPPPPPQQHYVPNMITTSNGGYANYHQPITPAGGAAAAAGGYAQQSYSLADAVVYEPPSGHQSPLFADRLAAEDAALFAASAGWDGSGAYFG